MSLLDRARAGDRRAVSRLLTLLDAAGPGGHPAVAEALRRRDRALVVGLTGPPGVGKSTLTSALIAEFRRRDRRVAVLCVDPSSPLTGGALLGDRIRMQRHVGDGGVFVRSMASRGHLGGLSAGTPAAVRVMEAAGFDVVLVETVGVGQSEVEIAALADTTAVVLAPGTGDAVQIAKAGVLEIGDVYVVNKADRPGAARIVRDLNAMTALNTASARPPVITTVATEDEGTAALVDELVARGIRRDGPTAVADVEYVEDEAALLALYGDAAAPAAHNGHSGLDARARDWLAAAALCLLATADAAGRCAVSPRGAARVLDDRTLVLPDGPGGRLDAHRDVLANPRVGLLFLVPGRRDALRVGGRARIVARAPYLAGLGADGEPAPSAIQVAVDEVVLYERWLPDAF
ncbi:methylmalonyl Co-A mutase-associated GTPase MeaB [Actinomadura atramentaria]|uniref:methylmalonyl Co-A mutase-associated GTPase MeaB n=1 Tax=Actinomadura atramentaria TaxID=1990 RepID=UPI00037A7C7E|nr:methylmalonyl Co-A mutase-associated GTPase MeaB [Actinomadura atramentaria]